MVIQTSANSRRINMRSGIPGSKFGGKGSALVTEAHARPGLPNHWPCNDLRRQHICYCAINESQHDEPAQQVH